MSGLALAALTVAVFSLANMAWCAVLWWRLRRLGAEAAGLEEASRRLEAAVTSGRELLEQLRSELVVGERALERRTEMARRRVEELGRLCEAAARLARRLEGAGEACDDGPQMATAQDTPPSAAAARVHETAGHRERMRSDARAGGAASASSTTAEDPAPPDLEALRAALEELA